MKRMILNPLLMIGMIGIFTVGTNFGVQLYRVFYGNQGIWWTAKTMPLSIDETKNSFELFITNKSLYSHISDGTLLVLSDNGHYNAVLSSDITARINNWNQVKSSILTNSLLSCFFFSVSFTMLIIGIFQVLGKKRDALQQGNSADPPSSRG